MAEPLQPPSEDVTEHLWNAAHEFLTAMRKLVDAADEFVTDQRDRATESEPDARLRRIDIDD